MPDEDAEMKSEKGKEILSYAYHSDYCVLEFDTKEDGTKTVTDITDHVQALEEIVNNE